MKKPAPTTSPNTGTWTVTATGGDYDPIPEDVHDGVCVAIWDVGNQYSEKFKSTSHKLVLTFELPDLEPIEIEGEERPRQISSEITWSLNEKSNLRRLLEAWRGKGFTEIELQGFDISRLLGKPAAVQVVHKETAKGTRAVISGLVKTKGNPKAATKPVLWSVRELTAKGQIPAFVPDWIRKKAEASEEYKALPVTPDTSSPADTAIEAEDEAESGTDEVLF